MENVVRNELNLVILPDEILVQIIQSSTDINMFQSWLTLCKSMNQLCSDQNLINKMKVKFTIKTETRYYTGDNKIDVIDSLSNGFIWRMRRYQLIRQSSFQVPTLGSMVQSIIF